MGYPILLGAAGTAVRLGWTGPPEEGSEVKALFLGGGGEGVGGFFEGALALGWLSLPLADLLALRFVWPVPVSCRCGP